MATYKKELISAYAFSGGTKSFDLKDTFRMKNYTVEAIVSGVTYPAGQDDAKIAIWDSEDGVNYEQVKRGFVFIPTGATKAKVRIVDLNTQNARIVFNPGTANGGTLDKLTITVQN